MVVRVTLMVCGGGDGLWFVVLGLKINHYF